jgi:peptidoglycan lytic transglycosylase
MRMVLVLGSLLCALNVGGSDGFVSTNGVASWYGEAHRGKPMANGKKFDPDQLTAASWFYPLGTRVRVALQSDPERTVLVTITDRGPARRYVRRGRIIDLAQAAFKELASPDEGLVRVTVEQVE